MRLLITADLHFNHPRSRPLAVDLIDRMNQLGGDAVLLIGDTAPAESAELAECLSRFTLRGPRLFIPGNHELWTHGPDSLHLHDVLLPQRLRSLGWHPLYLEPFALGPTTLVGSVGWYDYAFAAPSPGIPDRFYAAKISPGAAATDPRFASLFEPADDISPAALSTFARWNDGKFVKLGMTDLQFLDRLIATLTAHLAAAADSPAILAAIHHVPLADLLPPPASTRWDFARAFLGSPRLGETLLAASNLKSLYCGHSHFPATAAPLNAAGQPITAIDLGSGYRSKTFQALELAD